MFPALFSLVLSTSLVFPSVLLLDFQLNFVIISCKHLCLISAIISAVCLDKINLFLPERGKQTWKAYLSVAMLQQRIDSAVEFSVQFTRVYRDWRTDGFVIGYHKKTFQRTSVIIYRDNVIMVGVWKKYLYPQVIQQLSKIIVLFF